MLSVMHFLCARELWIFPPRQQYGNVTKKKHSLQRGCPGLATRTRPAVAASQSAEKPETTRRYASEDAGRRSRWVQGSHPERRDAGAFGVAAAGGCHARAGYGRMRYVLIGTEARPGDRPDVTRRGLVKNKNKIQSPSGPLAVLSGLEISCSRGGRGARARTARNAGRPSPVRPGPAWPAAHPCATGRAWRGFMGALLAGGRRPRAGSEAAAEMQRARGPPCACWRRRAR